MAIPLSLVMTDGRIGLVVHARPIAVAMTFATVLTLFLLSGTTLMALGVPYGGAGGNALLKIHPASYLSVLTVAVWVLADGGPGRFLWRSWKVGPGVLVFTAAIVLFAFQVLIQKTPISQLVDNFIMPVALFLALDRLDERETARLATLLHGIMLANSLIGYAEIVGKFHLVPIYVNGELADYDWRAVSLFGHPLLNAAMTALYIIILALGNGPFPPAIRRLLLLFHLGAMTCFGGRTATVLTLAALVAIAAAAAMRLLLGRRFRLEHAAAVTALTTLLVVVGIVGVDNGLLDQFLSRFQDDSGSANTRVVMLSIFRDLPASSVLLAPDQVIIHATQLKLNLAIAIESSLVGFVAYFGAIVTFFFFLGLGCYFAEFVRRYGPKALLPLAAYAFVSVSATSFATKSVELAMLTTIFMLVFGGPQYGGDRSDRHHRC